MSMEDYAFVEIRDAWRYELENHIWNEPLTLKLYRNNRDCISWRTARETEKLCEYILYLERLISKYEVIDVSENINQEEI